VVLVIGFVCTLYNHVVDVCPYQSEHTIQILKTLVERKKYCKIDNNEDSIVGFLKTYTLATTALLKKSR
jgi:hypothetical protein